MSISDDQVAAALATADAQITATHLAAAAQVAAAQAAADAQVAAAALRAADGAIASDGVAAQVAADALAAAMQVAANAAAAAAQVTAAATAAAAQIAADAQATIALVPADVQAIVDAQINIAVAAAAAHAIEDQAAAAAQVTAIQVLASATDTAIQAAAAAHATTAQIHDIQASYAAQSAVAAQAAAAEEAADDPAAASQVVCFAKGTLITTDHGPVTVEALQVGDLILTVSGQCEPVVWLGYSTIDCNRHHRQVEVHPIHIFKDAFGVNQPTRDLYLSPLHSVYVDGILIPAVDLVNGTTLLQEIRSKITYYHIELPTHNAIYAEGLAVESYFDNSNRHFFIDRTLSQLVDLTVQFSENQASFKEDQVSPQWFAKVVRNGPEVDAVRARLKIYAGNRLKQVA
jgi:Hint domain